MSRWNHSEFPTLAPAVQWVILGHGTRVGYFLCRCVCGVEREIRRDALEKGTSKSCTCIKASLVSKARTTHGRSRTPLHNVWWAMQERCYNEAVESYPLYGALGVTVCDRWRGPQGFENFLADMGERPSGAHQIDRYPNKDGNYEPGNCRWATPSQKTRNRKSNVNVTYNGITKCLSDWAAELGMFPQCLKYRIRKWGLERAMTTPKDPNKGRQRNAGSTDIS